MRTGSSVRSPGSDFLTSVTAFCVTSTNSLSVSSSASSLFSSSLSASSDSDTLMPMSESIDMMSSICSGEVVSDGSTSLSWSKVTKPRFLACLIIFLTAASDEVEQRRRRVRDILLGSVGGLVVFFLVLDLQRLCLARHSQLLKRAHAETRPLPREIRAAPGALDLRRSRRTKGGATSRHPVNPLYE